MQMLHACTQYVVPPNIKHHPILLDACMLYGYTVKLHSKAARYEVLLSA